jgi:hypothetical protein
MYSTALGFVFGLGYFRIFLKRFPPLKYASTSRPKEKLKSFASVSMFPLAPQDERLQLNAPVVRLIANVFLSVVLLPQYGHF